MVDEIKTIDERVVLGKNFRIFGTFENPLFLAKDVAEWIEHSNVAMMLQAVDDDEKTVIAVSTQSSDVDISNPYTQIGRTHTNQAFLTEEGLYEVLMLSRKPVAKEFKKQVKEILKTIRKTGGFVADNREPEFVAKYFPSFSEDVKLMMVQDLLNKQKQLQQERDEAKLARDMELKRKALINDNRTAVAVGRTGGLITANNRLREEVGFSKTYATILRINIITGSKYSGERGNPLVKYSKAHGYEMKKVPDDHYGYVNAYHADVWKAVYGVDLNKLVTEDNE